MHCIDCFINCGLRFSNKIAESQVRCLLKGPSSPALIATVVNNDWRPLSKRLGFRLLKMILVLVYWVLHWHRLLVLVLLYIKEQLLHFDIFNHYNNSAALIALNKTRYLSDWSEAHLRAPILLLMLGQWHSTFRWRGVAIVPILLRIVLTTPRIVVVISDLV